MDKNKDGFSSTPRNCLTLNPWAKCPFKSHAPDHRLIKEFIHHILLWRAIRKWYNFLTEKLSKKYEADKNVRLGEGPGVQQNVLEYKAIEASWRIFVKL